MGETLSPEQVARRAGVSRRTVVRAIRAGDLPASKSNDGRWRIEVEAVDAWAPPIGQPIGQDGNLPIVPTGSPTLLMGQPIRQPAQSPTEDAQSAQAELRERLAAITAERDALRERLTAEAETFRERLSEISSDRDAWQRQAERSLWERLFGRR